MMKRLGLVFLTAAVIFVAGCLSYRHKTDAEQRSDVIRGARGTYGAPPRLANRHVDIPKLLAELQDIHANTYHWLQRSSTDWDDLQAFLPKARAKKIKVWITLVPPSEPPASEPFKLDYLRWAKEIATLSVREPNLVAWSIDDFVHNLKLFTPQHVSQMTAAAHAINPKLAFVPCCYFKQMKPAFVASYSQYLDGVLFPYRAESVGWNLKDPTLIESEMRQLRELWGPSVPMVLDIYATAHSRLGPSTPEYVRELIIRGHKVCDGVLIYCHQDPQRNAEKYKVIREQFRKW